MSLNSDFISLASYIKTFGANAAIEFKRLDLDGDQKLNRVEMLTASMTPAALSNLFLEAAPGEGRLSQSQLSQLLGAGSLADALVDIFQTYDLNSDSAISQTELL